MKVNKAIRLNEDWLAVVVGFVIVVLVALGAIGRVIW